MNLEVTNDYFFDGLFADWAVGDRISESQSSVMSVRVKIEQAMNNYIYYYNNERISLKLKGMSPVQYRTHSQVS